MERSGLRFEFFSNTGCKIAAQKKSLFLGKFCLTDQDFLVLVFLTPLNDHFALIFRSPVSKLFCLSESSGKSNRKKWSQIWKLLLIKGVKSPRRTKFFLRIFFHLFTLLNCLFAPFSEVQCLNFLDFQNPWGKIMERNGLRYENFCL